MAALDTNVLVRFLVRDDPVQFEAARTLVLAAVQSGQTLFVPITVALELEWVLRTNFGFKKAEVVSTLSRLLATTELRFESESALEVALLMFSEGSADLSDCLHVALANAAGEAPLWTFDKAAAKLDGATLVRG